MPAPHILIADDSVSYCAAVESMLAETGFAITTAGNGTEAVLAVRMQKFDLVLLDLVMPDMDGLQAMREMRATRPGLKIIVMSGTPQMGNVNYLDAARALGADHTLQKPFTRERLLSAILRLLPDSSAGGRIRALHPD